MEAGIGLMGRPGTGPWADSDGRDVVEQRDRGSEDYRPQAALFACPCCGGWGKREQWEGEGSNTAVSAPAVVDCVSRGGMGVLWGPPEDLLNELAERLQRGVLPKLKEELRRLAEERGAA